jgi:hypothetical protein
MRNSPKPPKPRSPLARWTPSIYKLPALSVRQPWAWLICAGFKDIENRSRRTHYRGPLLIHAGLKVADVGRHITELHGLKLPAELETGGIVGIVDVVDCVEEHPSPWFAGTGYGWVLANPRRLRFRECKGALGLFRPNMT